MTLFVNAMSNFMEDNLGVSIDLLNEILDADSDDKLALLARGSVYLKMSNSKNAISDFDRAVKNDSKYAKAYHLRGIALVTAGSDDKALKDFDKAIDIDPEYGAAYHSRATLLTKMGQEDAAAEDMKMISHLTNLNIENFANENNIWRSRHMQLEGIMESEINR